MVPPGSASHPLLRGGGPRDDIPPSEPAMPPPSTTVAPGRCHPSWDDQGEALAPWGCWGGRAGGQVPGVGVGSHLGHVLGDDVKAAFLLHDHPQELHQVAVSELPVRRRRAQGRVWGRMAGLPHSLQGIGDHPPLLIQREVPPPLRCLFPPPPPATLTSSRTPLPERLALWHHF